MRKLLCLFIAIVVIATMSACVPSGVQNDGGATSPSAPTSPTTTNPPTVTPKPEVPEEFTKILSFVEKLNTVTSVDVHINQPSVRENEDGSFVVSDQGEDKLIIRLNPDGYIALASPASGDIHDNLALAKAVMLLLQGKELMPEEKQTIVAGIKSDIEALKVKIDAAWESSKDTELDTNLPDYSNLQKEADNLLKEIAELRKTITGG